MVSGTLCVLVFELILKQLLLLTSSVYALPVILGFAISFYGANPQKTALDGIKKLTSLGLFFSFMGLFTAFSEPLLLYYNLSAQGLEPRIPGLFEKGILAYTTSALCHGIGIVPLLIFTAKLSSLLQFPQHNKLSKKYYILLILSAIFFFVSIVLKSWPFAQYPDGIGKGYLCMLLLQQALHQFIGSFVPAGICVLALSWFTHKWSEDNSAATTVQNTYNQTYVRRFCYLTCIVGLAPQSLMALGRMTTFFLHEHAPHQPITALGESFFLVCSISFFGLLLFPRFSKSRLWQFLAILGYFISWNWTTIFANTQYWATT